MSEAQYLGQFRIRNRKFSGLVSLKGRNSRLEVYSDDPIPSPRTSTIKGVARSGEKVSVCDWVSESSGGRQYYGTSKEFLSVVPHYVAVGPRHLDANRNVVSEISFTTRGAADLFYEIGTVGESQYKNVNRLIPKWIKKDRRKINFSKVFYYINRGPIISVQTTDILFQVSNASVSMNTSRMGIQLQNQIRISLKFKKPRRLSDAVEEAYLFRAFCETVSLTRQSIDGIYVRLKSASPTEASLRVFETFQEVAPDNFDENISWGDNLIAGGTNRREFETVLNRWMASSKERLEARLRIVGGIRENVFTVDRLVGAANAFDILPTTARRPKVGASVLTKLEQLKLDARKLPPPYRNDVLGSLGRVEQLKLRNKIEARFDSLPSGLKADLPEMKEVIGHCVLARNFFVHGTRPKIPIEATRELLSFFTRTLEFIFVTSELCDCGWKYQDWLKRSNLGPFRDYLRSYDESKAELMKALPTKAGL